MGFFASGTQQQRDPSTPGQYQDVNAWNPVTAVGNGVNEVRNYLGYGPGKQQPGVGGPAADPSKLQPRPDGTFYDPTTGTSYSDPAGQQVIAAPNASQQVAGNAATSTSMLGRATGADTNDYQRTRGGQNTLLGELQNTATNPNAPSVAATQLGMNNDLNSRKALGAAAGVGGPNAFAARRQALQSIAEGNASTAGNAALVRAHEVATAQSQRGNILGQQASATGQRYGQDLGAAANYADLAQTGQSQVQGLNSAQDAEDKKNKQKFGTDILGGLRSATMPTPGQ